MVKTEFLIPKQDNEGHEYPDSYWSELEEQLLQFGGFTWTDGQVGAWRSRGKVYAGVSRRYDVDLPSWTLLAAWLEIVRWVARRFNQEAMYIEVAGVPEILD